MKDIKKSSDNLYADFGYKNPEEMQAKAVLAQTVYLIIQKKKLTQVEAAKILEIPQPHLSKLLRGVFSGFSTDRLLKLLSEAPLDSRSRGFLETRKPTSQEHKQKEAKQCL